MNGRLVVAAIILPAALAGGGLWYAQERAYYHEVAAGSTAAEFRLTSVDGAGIDSLSAGDFRGIDAGSSPLRYRGCFHTSLSLALLTESYRIYPGATPLNAPGWFDCFDAGRLARDLKSGAAVAFLSEAGVAEGVDRVVAIYPDGRAYAWNQLSVLSAP